MKPRKPYIGTQRKLVLSFDVGTTYSGISYCILDPGSAPEIKTVNRFPAQEQIGGDFKIPSLIYYDCRGAVKAVGAEALRGIVNVRAADEKWTKAEWFKLHLNINLDAYPHRTFHVPALPPGKTIVQVLADFYRYLLRCARKFISESAFSGSSLWRSLEQNIEFVLSHPNGWDGIQQTRMRQAAVLAGLVADTACGHDRIHFVSEGEASLHFCVRSGLMDQIPQDSGVVVVDAGGGTIDISSYLTNTSEFSFPEISASQCRLAGSYFVTSHAREFIKQKLSTPTSRYIDDLDLITTCFDRSSKHHFKDPWEPTFIKFGTSHDTDAAVGIRAGMLKLAGVDVAQFFEGSINAIIEAIVQQRCAAPGTAFSAVFLVGGFAASDYLFSRVKDFLQPLELEFCRPDTNRVNKAVADGAVSFFLDNFVSARVSKLVFGTLTEILYDPTKPDHVARKATVYQNASGKLVVPNAFDMILPKGVQVRANKEFLRTFKDFSQSLEYFKKISDEIVCYRGCDPNPRWADIDTGSYRTLCTITADTSQLLESIERLPSVGGRPPHYFLEYDIILSFGLTELKAQFAWWDKGVIKRYTIYPLFLARLVSIADTEIRSPATILYNEHDVDAVFTPVLLDSNLKSQE